MRRLAVILLTLAALPAGAAETRHAPTLAQAAQQERMRRCSATAKERGLHRDPRRDFMKECLGRDRRGQERPEA